jgi:hypothetical protein
MDRRGREVRALVQEDARGAGVARRRRRRRRRRLGRADDDVRVGIPRRRRAVDRGGDGGGGGDDDELDDEATPAVRATRREAAVPRLARVVPPRHARARLEGQRNESSETEITTSRR